MTSLNVLCPGGRRQNVKAAPTTTILQILEDVCKKQRLSAADFDLKHQRTVLDVTSTVRYSGLPNNAQLELVPITRTRQSSVVTLAIQDVEGQRHVHDFPPEITLAQVIQSTEQQSGKKLWTEDVGVPVCVYMQREIAGQEALQSTTLKQLGLTSGKAVIRLVSRNADAAREQLHVGGTLAKKEIQEEALVPRNEKRVEMKETSNKVCESKDEKPVGAETSRLAEIVTSNPEPSKQETVAPTYESAIQPGNKTSNEEGNVLENESQMEATPRVADEKALEEPVKDESNDVLVPLGSFDGLLYSMDDPTLALYDKASEDLPADFFDLTIDDAMKLQRDRRRELQEMIDAPMETSEQRAMRGEMSKLERLNRYRQAFLKCVLPDRFVLHASFKPSDTVETVRTFIQEHLREELQFVLYTTPPKRYLVATETLLDAQLFPSAMVYVGFPGNDSGPFLKESTQSSISTARAVLKEAARLRQESIRVSEPNRNGAVARSIPTPASTPVQNGQKRAAHSPTAQVPKCFKPSK